MKCGRCGYEIERLRNDWWSQEISNSYRKGQIHSNGFFCFGVHDGLGGKYHRKWVECVVWLLVPPTGRNALYTVLWAGFCERWPKACAMGLRLLRPAAFDYGKKLAANVLRIREADNCVGLWAGIGGLLYTLLAVVRI